MLIFFIVSCWLNTLYTLHCQLPDMVWSLQQVEVWPSTKEEEPTDV